LFACDLQNLCGADSGGPKVIRGTIKGMDHLRAFTDIDYWRAFRDAARKQPWATVLIVLFDLPGMSLVAYFRLVRGLTPTVQESLLVAALVLTALFVYKVGADAWREGNRQKVHLEDHLKPRLEFVFDPMRYPACMEETRGEDGTVFWRMFRVALVNTSDGETVDDVEVLLAGLEGVDRTKRMTSLPAPLVRMGDDALSPFRLNPGPTPVFLEVAGKVSAGTGNDNISLQCAGQLPNDLAPGRYRLRIVAKSRNAPEVEVLFNMYADASGILQLEQASLSRPTEKRA